MYSKSGMVMVIKRLSSRSYKMVEAMAPVSSIRISYRKPYSLDYSHIMLRSRDVRNLTRGVRSVNDAQQAERACSIERSTIHLKHGDEEAFTCVRCKVCVQLDVSLGTRSYSLFSFLSEFHDMI